LPFSKVRRIFGFAQKDDEFKRERNLPAAFHPDKPHVITGEELADDPLMKKIFSLCGLPALCNAAHILHLKPLLSNGQGLALPSALQLF